MGQRTCLSAQDLKPFAIYGDLGKVEIPVAKVTLSYYQGDHRKRDTCIVKDGKYFFQGKITESQLMSIFTIGGKKDYRSCRIYADPAVMHVINGPEFSDISVTGASLQSAYDDWSKIVEPYEQQVDGLIELRVKQQNVYNKSKNAKDSLLIQKYSSQMVDLFDMEIEAALQYANEHPNSPIMADLVARIYKPEYIKEREKLFNGMSLAQQQSRLGRVVASEMATVIGHMGPDFSLPDTVGKMVRLSDFRGKYVLLDFWASWCGPCRAESPYMLAAYKKYAAKGFIIFAVSNDQLEDKQEWLQAIKKDGTGIWVQTSSLTGNNNVAAHAYGHISAIPANFLLDPNGKIIAKDLRGGALNKKLQELLN